MSLGLAYPVVLYPLPEEEGGGWVAEVPDLPGCCSDGPTPADALKAVEGAQEAWLAVARKRGLECRPPAPDCSRPVLVRLPEELYRRLAMRAYRENRPHRVGEVAAEVLGAALAAAGGAGGRCAMQRKARPGQAGSRAVPARRGRPRRPAP